VHWIDVDGRIKFENPAAAKMLGYEVSDLIGKPAHATMHHTRADGAAYPQSECSIYATLRDGVVRRVSGEVFCRKDGSSFPVEYICTPVYNENGRSGGSVVIFTDITERKRAEEALQERAKLAALEADVGTALTRGGTFAEMLRLCSEAIVRHLDGAFARIWTLNEREKMLELQASAGRYTHLNGPHGRVPVGKFKIGLIAEERKPHLTNQVVGDPRVGDQEWAKREGMVAFAGYPLLVEDRLVGVVAMFACHTLTDTTLQALASISNNIAVGIERKRAEEALRASQQIIEGIINAIPVRVFWKDKNLVYLGCNAVFARDAGFADPKDIIGKDDYQMGWRDQADLYRGDDRQVIESGCSKLFIEEPQTTPEGNTITLLSSKLPLRSSKGEISGILGTYMDITERKRAEEVLRQRVKLQDQLVHTAAAVPGMIYSLRLRPDGSTQMPYASGALSEIFDLQPDDVIEDAVPIFSLVHPDDLGHVQATIAESARTLNPWRDEFRVRHARLGELWVEGHSVPQREPDGSILWHGFVQDITERKRLEALLFQSQKLETVGKLAGGIAHEFNSILTAIIGQSELLLGDLPAGSPLAKNATEISQAAERAATLTRQLLAYGRKQILQPEILDLNNVLAGMDGMLRPLMGSNVDLLIVPAVGLQAVKADAGQIEQVIMNIAINARDAMPNGGKLTLETANVTLDQEYVSRFPELKAGEYVMLAITDTGAGMSEEAKTRVFEPFFSTKGVGQGTGLGLSTCYGIIKQSGGDISVDSEPGRGTTLKIYLPQVEPQTKIPIQRLDSPDLPRGTETILLVEDDPALRAMAATLLRRLGYTVLAADDDLEALSLTHQESTGYIDLLFTDVVTPQMSGKELSDRIHALHPNTKILFASAYTESAIVHQGALNPGVELLQKPFTPSALALKVREVLDQPSAPKPDTAQETFGLMEIPRGANTP
jgi:PAS domain S-box-containing protein